MNTSAGICGGDFSFAIGLNFGLAGETDTSTPRDPGGMHHCFQTWYACPQTGSLCNSLT